MPKNPRQPKPGEDKCDRCRGTGTDPLDRGTCQKCGGDGKS